jgi:hypothetical protein
MGLANLITPGMEAIDVVEKIFQFHGIKLMKFVVYLCEEKPHFAEAKVINPNAKRCVVDAIQHTPDFGQPTIFVQSLDDFKIVRGKISGLKEIDPDTVRIHSYLEDAQKPRIHEAIKVVSKVETQNGIFHIPLLDLDMRVDENNAEVAKDVFVALGIKSGVIINSGASYHGWGLELLSEDEWAHFMATALLLDKIDRRWVGHRLKDKQANLRISEKRHNIPKVVYAF